MKKRKFWLGKKVLLILKALCGSLTSKFEDFQEGDKDDNDHSNVNSSSVGVQDQLSSYHPKSSNSNGPSLVGKRNIDRDFVWDTWDCDIDESEINDLFVKVVGNKLPCRLFCVEEGLLSSEQRQVMSLLRQQVKCVREGYRPPNSICNCTGWCRYREELSS